MIDLLKFHRGKVLFVCKSCYNKISKIFYNFISIYIIYKIKMENYGITQTFNHKLFWTYGKVDEMIFFLIIAIGIWLFCWLCCYCYVCRFCFLPELTQVLCKKNLTLKKFHAYNIKANWNIDWSDWSSDSIYTEVSVKPFKVIVVTGSLKSIFVIKKIWLFLKGTLTVKKGNLLLQPDNYLKVVNKKPWSI